MTDTIAFIGGGNMARSLIGGLLREGFERDALRACEPNLAIREGLAEDFGIATSDSNLAVAKDAGVWVLAVKPQVMSTVLAELGELAAQLQPLVISIAAGVTIARIDAALGGHARVVRTMPNTPALIGAGVTGLCVNTALPAKERALVERLLGAAGATVWIEEEAQMDVVTALSGSGPAYFFLMVEALINAGMRQGLPPATAAILAKHTALGAARMTIESDEPPQILRQRVTSPGGTTAAAIAALESGGFAELVDHAVDAATRRGRELGS